MKSPTTPSNAETELDSQQSLLDRLQDSADAMNEIRSLTQQMGTFVVRSRIQHAKRAATAISDNESSSRKRRRVEPESSLNTKEVQCEQTASAKRMFVLYQQLKQSQALFQREIEHFVHETEETCTQAEQAISAVSITAE